MHTGPSKFKLWNVLVSLQFAIRFCSAMSLIDVLSSPTNPLPTAEVRAANERSLLIRQQQLSSSVALKALKAPWEKKKKKICQGNITPAYLVAQKPEKKRGARKHIDASLARWRSRLNLDVKTLPLHRRGGIYTDKGGKNDALTIEGTKQKLESF